jgi:hypothetical protein
MKATLTFDLDSPEDKAAHLRCTKALDLVLCLNEFRSDLLAQHKYKELSVDEKQILLYVNSLLNECFEEYGINLSELDQ